MTVLVVLIGLSVVAALMFEAHEHRAERLERLNRESWELLRASRRIHDETAEALQSMFEEARLKTRATGAHEIGK